MTFQQLGSTRLRTLQAPIKDLKPFTVEGGGHDSKAAIRCGLADNLPWDHIQARTEQWPWDK